MDSEEPLIFINISASHMQVHKHIYTVNQNGIRLYPPAYDFLGSSTDFERGRTRGQRLALVVQR